MATTALLDLPNPPEQDLELEVLALGRRLGERHRSVKLAKRAAHDRAMALVAADPQLRAALFRLVDVAPACRGTRELADHLAAYLDSVEDPAIPVVAGGHAADSAALGRLSGRVAALIWDKIEARRRG